MGVVRVIQEKQNNLIAQVILNTHCHGYIIRFWYKNNLVNFGGKKSVVQFKKCTLSGLEKVCHHGPNNINQYYGRLSVTIVFKLEINTSLLSQ